MFWRQHLEPMYLTNDPHAGSQRRYKCTFCDFSSTDKKNMGQHYDVHHKNMIPDKFDGYTYFYYLLTGKENGGCVVCKGLTKFNRASMKYSRFCDNPDCKKAYREEFKQRMIGKHGRIHLLDDPDMQKRMLSKRKISGEYIWSCEPKASFTYTGTYELDFLRLLDLKLHWDSSDIVAPSPHVYTYEYGGKSRFYMPDFFIPSLNLEIEIKSDSIKHTNMESYEKDEKKNELMLSNFNFIRYCRIMNKDYTQFLEIIKEA